MKNLLQVLILVFASFSMLGQCVQGDCENGEGVMIYKSGNKYMGAFKNGQKHGYGKFIWISGAKYKGNWSSNKRSGYGEEYLADGTYYKGGFKMDKKNGEGTLYDAQDRVLKKGQWKNGAFISTSRVSSNNTNYNHSSSESGVNYDRYINLGLGLGSTLGVGSISNGQYSSFPPLSLSIDLKQINEKFKLGGYIGYASDKITYNDNFYGDWGWKNSFFILGLRGTYDVELFKDPKINTYVGGMIGYNVVRASYFGDDAFSNNAAASASGISYSGFLGLRYMFNNNYGAFAELGYGIAYLTAGVTKKF